MNPVLVWFGVVVLFCLIGIVICVLTQPGYPSVKSHTQLTEDIVKTMTEGK